MTRKNAEEFAAIFLARSVSEGDKKATTKEHEFQINVAKIIAAKKAPTAKSHASSRLHLLFALFVFLAAKNFRVVRVFRGEKNFSALANATG